MIRISHKKPRAVSIILSTLISVMIPLFDGDVLAAAMPVMTTLENQNIKGLAKPGGIAIDQETGNIYVSDIINQTINVYSKNGIKLKTFGSIHVPNGISVGNDGNIYVIGYSNGAYTVFSLNAETGVNNGPVNYSVAMSMPSFLAVDSSGNIYVIDSPNHKILVFDKTGVLKSTYGPYTFTKSNETLKDSVSGTSATYASTMHSLVSPSGIAINDSTGELYIQFNEVVESIDSTMVSSCSSTFDSSLGKYLTPRGDYYKVAVIGLNDGILNEQKSMLLRDYTVDSASCSSTSSTGVAINPTGMAMDETGRLYAADGNWGLRVFDPLTGSSLDSFTSGRTTVNKSAGTVVTIDGVQYRAVTVTFKAAMPDSNYIAAFAPPSIADGTEFDPSGIKVTNKTTASFTLNVPSSWVETYGMFVYWRASYAPATTPLYAIAYDSDNNRLIGTIFDGTGVDIYGIDGGSNPSNVLPEAPVPVSPSNGSVVNTATPALEVQAAYDADGDQLTYTYELTSSSGTVSGTSSTIYSFASPLHENDTYRWRVKAGDSEGDSSWSQEFSFCVDANNDIPSVPAVNAPVDGATVSPFTSSLAWAASADPDCVDSVTYTVEVSADNSFASVISSVPNLIDTTIKLGNIAGLQNNTLYYWRVKAVDSRGGESAYSGGSFVYKTSIVKFVSDQPNTKVYLDGNYGYSGRLLSGIYDESGKALEVQGISPGSHFVTFIQAGFEPSYALVTVADPLNASEPVEVSVSMKKAHRINIESAGEPIATVAGPASPFVVDYNNDGLKDLMVGSGDGKVYLYTAEEQTNTDGMKTAVLVARGTILAGGAEINVGANAVPFVADYNNDGKKDILVGGEDGGIRLYLNTADDVAPIFADAETIKDEAGSAVSVDANAAPSIVDYNNDGKKDLLVGSYDGFVRLYINAGDDSAPLYSSPALITINNGSVLDDGTDSRVFFTDWNADGKKDLVVGGGGSAKHYLNVGTGEAASFLSISALKSWIKTQQKQGNTSYKDFLGFNNDLADLSGESGYAAPFVVQWDGDGPVDLVVGRGNGDVVVYSAGE